MAYFGKVFKLEDQQNFEEYVKALDLPEDIAQIFLKTYPTQKIVKNGDSFTISTNYGSKVREITFKLGVEFDEELTEDFISKTTVTVNGDIYTHVQKFPDGRTVTVERKFSTDSLKETLSTNKWSGTAVRYYST